MTDASALKRYTDEKAKGKGNKEALRLAGLKSHIKADLAWYEDPRNPKAVKRDPKFPTTDDAAGVRAAELRTEGKSWGQIAVISGLSEGRVRTLSERATKLASEGMRIGKGGRFLKGEGALYKGNRKSIGIEHERGKLDEAAAKDAEKVKSQLPARVKRAKGGARKRVATQAEEASE